MNESTQHKQSAYDPFLDERMHHLKQPAPPNEYANQPFYDPYGGKMPRKGKFVAGLLAFFFPGLGHFYLGLMQRGFMVMLCFALNIVAIVYSVSLPGGGSVPLVVLLSLLVPAIYFYNLFDALQCTDRVNAERIYGIVPEGMTPLTSNGGVTLKGSSLGLILVVCGVCVLMFSVNPAWLQFLFSSGGPYFGAVLLIVAGLFLLLRTRNK